MSGKEEKMIIQQNAINILAREVFLALCQNPGHADYAVGAITDRSFKLAKDYLTKQRAFSAKRVLKSAGTEKVEPEDSDVPF